ncbi:glycosyltransferase family 2 protein, partial [Escherichia coli]|nr:glycosyltransferase family 2 protein [Escherichia coli]
MLGAGTKPDITTADPAQALRLRWRRKRLLWRAFRKRREVTRLHDRTARIMPDDILLFSTIRNEAARLPYFLRHYRALGVAHFLFVDNDSSDETVSILAQQPDVSLWRTGASYRDSRFGVDWLTWLQRRYGHGHWCLTADADELLMLPHHGARDLRDLTDWLDARGTEVFAAVMVDLYPKGRL